MGYRSLRNSPSLAFAPRSGCSGAQWSTEHKGLFDDACFRRSNKFTKDLVADAAFISVYTTRHTRNWDKSSSTGHYTCHTGDAGGAGVLNTRSTRSHAHPQRKYKSRHHATSLDGETGLSPRASQSRPYSNTRKNLGARRLCRRPLLACRHGRRSLIGGAGSLSSCNIVMLMSWSGLLCCSLNWLLLYLDGCA